MWDFYGTEDLQGIFVRALDKKVPAEGVAGKRKFISKREALLRTLIDKAEAGNRTAAKLVLDFYYWDEGNL